MRFEQETVIEPNLMGDCIPDLGRLGILMSSLGRQHRNAAGAVCQSAVERKEERYLNLLRLKCL